MKLKFLPKHLFLAFIATIVAFHAQAQIQIEGPATICSGDLANFKTKNSSGKTIQSYVWDFGDSHGSKLATPSILYRKTGTYTISCEVTFSDNSTAKATHSATVLELPVSNFTTAGNITTFCQYHTHVCFENKSTAAATDRPLHKMIVTWGDGNLDVVKNIPLPGDICHDFDVTGDFKIRFEIVDTKGCKNTDYKRINVVEGVKAELETSSEPDCNSTKFCATAKVKPATAVYEWSVNGTKMPGNKDNFCNTYYTKTKLDILLIAKNPKTLCKDTAHITDSVDVGTNSAKLKLRGHSVCYNDSDFWATLNVGGKATNIEWFLNGRSIQKGGNSVSFNTKNKFYLPGKYTLKCVLFFGKCKLELSDTFRINGPVAKIKGWNTTQCNTNYKVFFMDSSRFGSAHSSWHWSTEDGVSDDCTIWRAKNKNRYKNCFYTLDNWGKHKYPQLFTGMIDFVVYDSVSGCSDDTSLFVNLNACSVCHGKGGHKDICQGDTFLKGPLGYFSPRYFSLDTGKTWIKFPARIDKPYLGTYAVGFIVPLNFPNHAEDFGDDSFRIVQDEVIYDTFFQPDFLTVNETPELEFVSAMSTGCRDCRVKLLFNNHKFKADQNLFITWKGKEYQYFFDKDTIIDSLIFQTGKKGGAPMVIKYFNGSGCASEYNLYAGCGMDLDFEHDRTDCFGNQHCLKIVARDNAADSFYNLYNSGLNYKVKWDNKWYNKQVNICDSIKKTGKIPLEFICTDRHGCTDTMHDSIMVQKVVAGVTSDSKLAFCSELKQLFDSSYAIGGDGTITEYGWNFNRRNRNSDLKDPVQLFEKGGKNHIIHWVTSSYGCSDSIEYDVEIQGGNPYFTIPDTMGCQEFKARFINRSVNCKTYIWEFGDPAQNIMSVSDTNDVEFTYTTPGVFNINLIGIDTVYSPITGEAYHCHSEFPDNPDTIRRVHVLPFYKSTLTGPDSVCENQVYTIKSGTDSKAGYEKWSISGNYYKRFNAGSLLVEKHLRGTYTYQVKPDYGWTPDEPYCADTPTHKVVVIGVDAEFDFKSPLSDGNYKFTNLSSTDAVAFNWNFGHPNSGSKNTSTDKDPEHDYFPDTGNFKVCLVAKNALGCIDTVCKYVPQYYMEYLYLANVFTPESMDGKNDLYDVVIEGEKQYDLKIMNRYGELVYHSQTDGDRFKDNLNWNGKVHNTGAICPEGTYFYQFTWSYKRSPEKVRTLSGSVNLIR